MENSENKAETISVEPNPMSNTPTRTDVLCLQWTWVKKIEAMLNDEKTTYDGKHRAKIYDIQTLFSGCKTVLQGLRDAEEQVYSERLEKLEKDIQEVKEKLGLK